MSSFIPPAIPANTGIPSHVSPSILIKKINDEASGVWASFGVDSYERAFLINNAGKDWLTVSQWALLSRIWDKVFPNGEED